MRKFNRLLGALSIAAAVGGLFTSSISTSKADIVGSLGVAGTNTIIGTNIVFLAAGSSVTTLTQDFLTVLGPLSGASASFPTLVAYDLNNFAAALGGTPLFTVTDGVDVATLIVNTSQVDVVVPGVNATLSGTGTLHLSGFPDTPGTWGLSTQPLGGTTALFNFSAGATAVPGPIVGAGVPGLIAGAFGLYGFARRRRRKFA